MKKLMRLAEQQHSVFSRGQALQLITAPQLKALVERGTVERVVYCVYRVSGSVPTWRQRLMVAVLAAGPGAAVSGRAAAALLKLPGYYEGPVEVTQTRRPSRRYKYGREHSTTYLPEHHITVIDGIPVTCVERTVFDLSGRRSLEGAKHLVKSVVGRKVTTLFNLSVVLAETGAWGRPGTVRLREALTAVADKPLTESELEDLVLTVLARAGLPLPECQVDLGDANRFIGRVDFLYRTARLVIEADSKRWHGEWVATEADQRRDKLLTTAGFHVIHTNWHELINEPEVLVDAVRAVLERAA